MKNLVRLLFGLVVGAQGQLALAQNPYLGTNPEDIQAGLARVMGEQLRKEQEKQRDVASPKSGAGDSVKAQAKAPASWDDDVLGSLKADAAVPPTPSPLPTEPKVTPLPPVVLPPAPRRFSVERFVDDSNTDDSWQVAGPRPSPSKDAVRHDEVLIPAGSYVTGELLTGVDAPANASVPTLIRMHAGFAGPNEGFVDMAGCHSIAKANGDLSTERIKLETVNLACVSPSGGTIQIPMVAFGAGRDGEFGISGTLNSRQGRVALLAFLNGIVEGATKIVSQPSIPGVNQEPPPSIGVIGAQSGNSASSEVVRWYLEQARSLFPSVEAPAGTAVRLVLLEAVRVPRTFFRHYTASHRETAYESSMPDPVL